MSNRYTKADLEQIVYSQLENLNAMHDLLNIMKVQNELLHNANKKLKDEISEFKEKQHAYPTRKRSSKS
jgi:HEAT repeat protein